VCVTNQNKKKRQRNPSVANWVFAQTNSCCQIETVLHDGWSSGFSLNFKFGSKLAEWLPRYEGSKLTLSYYFD